MEVPTFRRTVGSDDETETSVFNPHASVSSNWLAQGHEGDHSEELLYDDYDAAVDANNNNNNNNIGDDTTDSQQESARGGRQRLSGTGWQLSSTQIRSPEELQALSVSMERTTKRTRLLALLVLLIGAAASASFMYLGIHSMRRDVDQEFQRRASDMATGFQESWRHYETSALFIHQACRNWRETNFTWHDFEILYEYLINDHGGLDFFAAQWIPNVTHAERPALEAQLAEIAGEVNAGAGVEGLENYTYQGFVGQESDPNNPDKPILTPRAEQPFYFPIHFWQPAEDWAAAHYDLMSAPWERPTIEKAIDTWAPSLTGRFELVGPNKEDIGYSVVLYHPGAKLSDKFNAKPRDLATMVINIRSLLARAAKFQSADIQVHLYDKTVTLADNKLPPEYLSALEVRVSSNDNNNSDDDQQHELTVLPEVPYSSLRRDYEHYFEEEIFIGGHTWITVVVPVQGTTGTNPEFIVLSGILMFLGSLLVAAWMVHNMRKSMEMHQMVIKAAAEASIVNEMFPETIRDRLIQEARAKYEKKKRPKTIEVEVGSMELTLVDINPSEVIFGSAPIAESHPYTTVLIANVCNFSAWASARTPPQVFTLLEILYHSFDSLAKKHGVYKVETIGDKYIAVAGLPKARKDHAVVIARFATDCARRMLKMCKSLERTLGPETGDLVCKFGMHSGQVLAGVLRGEKSKFSLFGETVIKAAKMESCGVPNKIQVSPETCELLREAGLGSWLIPREDSVLINGQPTQTFFLHITRELRLTTISEDVNALSTTKEDRLRRLVDWNVEVLRDLLKNIVARRQALFDVTSDSDSISTSASRRSVGAHQMPASSAQSFRRKMSRPPEMPLEEVTDVLMLPDFDVGAARKQVDPKSIELDPLVVDQLKSLVTRIASMYRDNPFHCFEHASHSAMCVVKMMERIVNPRFQLAKRVSRGQAALYALHDHTFGITSDPLTQFGCIFSALIACVDHPGVPNSVLIQEGSPLAQKYKNKSMTQQNSFDLVWEELMKPDYDKLQDCIGKEEFPRLRSIVINAVMSTDLHDKDLSAARTARWHKAFSAGEDWAGQQESRLVKTNRKATIVIEYLMQASYISHTMQHYSVFSKWEQKFFHERYKAYKAGRLDQDPADEWYDSRTEFFDNFVLPLAKKLFTCGVFGTCSDELLNYAVNNRKEWAERGDASVKKYIESVPPSSALPSY